MTALQVGDTVRLTDTGLETIYGTRLGLDAMKLKTMKITSVDDKPITNDGSDIRIVTVDDGEINAYLINTDCFEKVDEDYGKPVPGNPPLPTNWAEFKAQVQVKIDACNTPANQMAGTDSEYLNGKSDALHDMLRIIDGIIAATQEAPNGTPV